MKVWAKTLLATFIGAAAGAVGTALTTSGFDYRAVLIAGAVAAAAYLAKSPLPEF